MTVRFLISFVCMHTLRVVLQFGHQRREKVILNKARVTPLFEPERFFVVPLLRMTGITEFLPTLERVTDPLPTLYYIV